MKSVLKFAVMFAVLKFVIDIIIEKISLDDLILNEIHLSD